jgi:hypothetical protein
MAMPTLFSTEKGRVCIRRNEYNQSFIPFMARLFFVNPANTQTKHSSPTHLTDHVLEVDVAASGNGRELTGSTEGSAEEKRHRSPVMLGMVG